MNNNPSYHIVWNGETYTAYAVEDSDIQVSHLDPIVALQMLRRELRERGLI